MKTALRLMAVIVLSMMATTAMAQDWDIFELNGKVKSVTYYDGCCPFIGVSTGSYERQVVTFDAYGRVITPRNGKIVRNNLGVAKNIQYYFNEVESGEQELIYNSMGLLIHINSAGCECCTNTELTYNSNGCVSSMMTIGEGEGDGWTEMIYYEYLSFDSRGNWTKRIRTSTTTYGYDNSSWTETETETRTIVYY